MNKQMIAAIALAAAATLAHASEQEAYAGVAADAATTAAALATPGFGETNPLGWATVPIRVAIVQYAKTLPREEGQPLVDMTSASGWGAAANNLIALLGAGPAAPIVGLGVAYAVWKRGETEREFWQICAVHKRLDPAAQCTYSAWTPEHLAAVQARVQPVQLAAATMQVLSR